MKKIEFFKTKNRNDRCSHCALGWILINVDYGLGAEQEVIACCYMWQSESFLQQPWKRQSVGPINWRSLGCRDILLTLIFLRVSRQIVVTNYQLIGRIYETVWENREMTSWGRKTNNTSRRRIYQQIKKNSIYVLIIYFCDLLLFFLV